MGGPYYKSKNVCLHFFFANDFKIKTIKYILKCKFLTTICTPAQNKEKNERTRQEQLSVSLAELRLLTLNDAGFLEVFFFKKWRLSYQIFFEMKI